MTKKPLQNFKTLSNVKLIAPKIMALREKLKTEKIDAFLVPRADMFRGENVRECDERLAYISGFTGSAGLAIIGLKKAALFVDSRYILQAPKQTDIKIFEIKETPPASLAKWINKNFTKETTICFDAWLHTKDEIKQLKLSLNKNIKLTISNNFIDKIWQNRPKENASKLEFLDIEQTGKSAAKKLSALQKIIKKANCNNLVLTLPENICWLFNMRANDIKNTPVALCFALIPIKGEATIFLANEQINEKSKKALKDIAKLEPKENFENTLKSLTKETWQKTWRKTWQKTWIDSNSAPLAITQILKEIYQKQDPIISIKAKKNNAELKGMKQAHILDGIAMAKFLCWFDKKVAKETLSEIDIVKQLENFRQLEKTFKDISFDTIAGAGANGAIVHYRVDEKSNRNLKKGELMLVDSGAQYLSGTTDITRTLYTGASNNEQKDSYTRVLKGMIAISNAHFPIGTTGAQIDILARQFLWQKGLNYNHGTGHGVGVYLNVHEGGTGISPRANFMLKKGHIISNEPGYYKTGKYGIRIENLIHIVKSKTAPNYLKFKTLTLTPIETRLIKQNLLTKDEVNWLNNYHKKVWKKINPFLDEENKEWLEKATKAI